MSPLLSSSVSRALCAGAFELPAGLPTRSPCASKSFCRAAAAEHLQPGSPVLVCWLHVPSQYRVTMSPCDYPVTVQCDFLWLVCAVCECASMCYERFIDYLRRCIVISFILGLGRERFLPLVRCTHRNLVPYLAYLHSTSTVSPHMIQPGFEKIIVYSRLGLPTL